MMRISDQELLSRARITSKTELAAALELLKYLVEIDSRRLYAVQGYSTLHEFIVEDLGFSPMQAAERSNTVRLMRSVPEMTVKIENRELSITTASQIQRLFNLEQRH